MVPTTRYPFEVPHTEIEADVDAFINAVFDTLQSSFLFLPRGPGFVTYPEFQQAYEVLKRHTVGFTSVEPGNVMNALREDVVAFIVLRAMLGFTPPELAYVTSRASGVTVSQGFARNFDRQARVKGQVLQSLEPQSQKRIAAMVSTACQLLNEGAETEEITPDMIHRLDKADTRSGLVSLRHLAIEGVPYAMLLYERFLGRPFAHHFLASCILILVSCFLLPPQAHAAYPTPIASYTITVTLDAEAKTLTGHQVVTYLNTTADPIPDLVFHLYLNAFRDSNSIFLRESRTARGFGWDPQHPGWIQITRIRLADAGEYIGTSLALEEIEDGTLARAELPTAVAPGETVQIELDFQAQLPRVFARTGYAGDFLMVGQWFPKLGVWQNGAWNAYPFHANAEFYADFGTYDVSITLPGGYVTGGTGLPVSQVDNGDGTQTVRYRAENVIDFAWAASPDFQEVTRRVDGVEILYLYLPEHAWTVGRTLEAAKIAMHSYGRWYGPYPYARLTIVDVPDDGQGAGGMEYPTLVTAGTLGTPRLEGIHLLEVVVVHEIGHQWWQSMVGFNEAEEPWLDEGFTDYSTLRAMDATYGSDTSLLEAGGLRMGYLELRRAEYLSHPRVPMYGRAWDFRGMDYDIAAYSKPVVALSTLERTLGEETMLDVLSTFFRRYQFGHPTTEDFRAVAEEITGQDLAWFFDGLVYGDGVVNYTVTQVDEHEVTVARQGAPSTTDFRSASGQAPSTGSGQALIIPTEVLVTFADGSRHVESWDGAQTEVTLTYPDRPAVRSAEVDPEHKVLVDLRWTDNGLSRHLEVSPWLALVTRLLYGLQNALLGGL